MSSADKEDDDSEDYDIVKQEADEAIEDASPPSIGNMPSRVPASPRCRLRRGLPPAIDLEGFQDL
jgi:hypothetical protein